MQLMTRSESFIPQTAKPETRTIEVVWSTGAKVLRKPWAGEPYYEELSLKAEHVDLSRLQKGAPLLNNHRSDRLEDQIGVVEEAWLEGGQAKARLRFADDEASEQVFKKVCSGILRNLSVGYHVHEAREIKTNAKIKTLLATRWEPVELSFVTIPADAGAQSRSLGEPMMEDLESKNAPIEAFRAPAGSETPEEVETPEKACLRERERVAQILSICSRHGVPEDLRQSLVEQGIGLEQTRAKVLDFLVTKSPPLAVNFASPLERGYDEREIRSEAMANAILHRLSAERHPLAETARPYAFRSLLDLARLEQEKRGERTSGLSDNDIAQRSFHATSDFPLILSNVANKELLASYQEKMKGQSFRPLVQEKTFDNFKEKTSVRYGELPSLERLNEGEEVSFGTLGESGEKWAIGSFAKGLSVTRKAIINNDLDAFEVFYRWGQSISRLESKIVWAIFTDNKKMADSRPLFDRGQHKNEAAKGSALDVKALGQAIYEMSLQQGIDQREGDYLDISPSYLIVPSALDQHARRLIYEPFQPNELEKTNPYRGRFTVISEPRLNTSPETAVPWYLATSPKDFPVIYVGYLNGQRQPSIESQVDFKTRSLLIRCDFDFGATAADYRGVYRNPGVKVEA